MTWQPIETAPRDGTVIQVRDVDGDLFTCRFWTGAQLSEYQDDGEEWQAGWLTEDIESVDPISWQSI